MKKRISKKRIKTSLFASLAAISVFTTVMPQISIAVQASGLQEELTGTYQEDFSDEEISEMVELDYGRFYLKENSEYRIVYIVSDEEVEYSIVYKDNPNIVNIGHYALTDKTKINFSKDISSESMVEILKTLDVEEQLDLSERRVADTKSSADAISEIKKLKNYRTPGSTTLGSTTRNGITAKATEHILGTMITSNSLRYYSGDLITSIIAAIPKLTLPKALKIISNVASIITANGTVEFYIYDNSRTKLSSINSKTYFSSGHDVRFEAAYGDKKRLTEESYNKKYSDYDQNATYFNNKALDAYFN